MDNAEYMNDALRRWDAAQKRVLERLEDLQAGLAKGARHPPMGLCNASGSAAILSTCWRDWPQWTGSNVYPVPAPAEFKHPSSSSMVREHVAYFCTKPDAYYTGEYGESRRDLLQHCITVLRSRLEAPTGTLWGYWDGCLVDGEREPRAGFTIDKLYELRPVDVHGPVPRFKLLDDHSVTRLRSWDDFDFEVLL